MSWINVLLPELRSELERKNLGAIKELLKTLKPQDIAELVEELEDQEKVLVLRLLDKETIAHIFSELPPQEREELFRLFTRKEVADLLNELDPDDRARFFDELPAEMVKKLLTYLKPEEREVTQLLLNYPPDSVGHAMTPEMVELKPDMTVEDALKFIRENAPEKETIYVAYVTDKEGKLIGRITLADIVLASPERKIVEIMDPEPVKVRASDDREVAAELISKYDLLAIPVVDSEDKLLGIVTFDDVIDIIEEEATEDIHRLAAMEAPAPEEEYFRLKLWRRVRKRLPWLVGLIIAEIGTGSILKNYSHALGAIVALAYFIPMLIDTGGNVGSQAVTLVVRALATHEISGKDFLRVIAHEFFSGLLLGLPLGIISFTISFILTNNSPVSIAVGISLSLVVIISNIIGLILPFFFKLFKIDPAVASNPLITTIMDNIGLIIYFYVALFIIRLLGG